MEDLIALVSDDGSVLFSVSEDCEQWDLHSVDKDGTAIYKNRDSFYADRGWFCRIRQETSPISLNSTPCEFERVEWLTAYDVKEAIELAAMFAEVQF